MTKNKWAIEVINSNMEGYTKEEQQTHLQDIAEHGCVSGCVSGAIYYNETEKLFKDNMIEILETVADYTDETGYNPLNTIAEKEETETLYNSLVWLVIELTASNLLNELESEEN